MSIKCRLNLHDFQPYRYKWVEFMSVKRDTPYNREGSDTLTHVYCRKCGEIREVINVESKRVVYRKIP